LVKTCTKCGHARPRSEFYTQKDKKDGLDSWCRGCRSEARRNRYYGNHTHELERGRNYYDQNREQVNERNKGKSTEWYRTHPDGAWAQWLKKQHGMLPAQWYATWEEQDGLCYLCEQPLPGNRSKVAIDHDHGHCGPGMSCGFCRRGFTHSNCNSGIGMLGDNPQLLRLAAANLERAQAVVDALLIGAPIQDELPIPNLHAV
jgi:hypothetical protein